MAVNPNTPVLNTDPFNNLYYDNKLVRSHLNHDLEDPNYYTGAGTITYSAIANNLSDSGTSWDEDNTGLRDLFNQLNLDQRSWPDGFVDSAGALWTNVPLNTKGYTLLLDSDGKRAIYGVMPFYNTAIVDDNENLPYPDMANNQTNVGERIWYIHGSVYQGNTSSSKPFDVSINYRASELGMITTFYEIKDMLIAGDIMTGKWSKPYHFISGEPGNGSGNYTASPAPFQNKRSVYNLNEIIYDLDLINGFPFGYEPVTIQNLVNMPDKNVDTGPSAGGDTLYFNFNKSGTKLYYIRSFIQFDANESISYSGNTQSSDPGFGIGRGYTFIDGVRPDATHQDYKVVSNMNVLHLDTPWDITSISKHEIKEVFPDNRDKIVAAFSVDSNEKIKTLSRYIGVGEEAGGVDIDVAGYNMPAIDIFEPSYSSSFDLNHIRSEYDPTTGISLDSAFDPIFYKSDQKDVLNKNIQSKFFVEDSSKTYENFYNFTVGREHPLVSESRLNNFKYQRSNGVIDGTGVWKTSVDSSSEWTLIKGGYSNVNDKYPDLSLAYKSISANDVESFLLNNPKLSINSGLDNLEANFALVKNLKNPIIFADSADENFGTKIFNIKDDPDGRTFPEYRNPTIYSQIHGNIDKTFSFSEGNYDLNSVILYNKINFLVASTSESPTAANFPYTKGATKYIKNYYGRFELINLAEKFKTSAFTNSSPTSNSGDSDLFEFLLSS